MKHKRLVVIIIVFLLLWVGAVTTDYIRAQQQQDPLFTFRTIGITDGGTVIRIGLGYKVIHFNQMPYYGGRTDIVFQFGMKDIVNL